MSARIPLLVLVSTVLFAADPPADAVLEAWPQGGGLTIVIAPAEAAPLIRLSNEGRMLVHGLCADDAGRDRLRGQLIARGVYGLVSVATWHGAPRLPYASRLANVVIADLDAAEAPRQAELERVVAPGGVLFLRRKGAWQATPVPRPAGIDDWGHFDHGPDGNPLSTDTVSGPARQQQWVTGAMPNPSEGNPAGFDPGAGLRISGRYVLLDLNDAFGKAPGAKQWALQARDAWNGVPLWTVPRDSEVARRRWSLAVDDSGVYAYLARGGDLTVLDPATGRPLRTLAGTAPLQANGKPGLDGETVSIRLLPDLVVLTVNGAVHGFDKRTGSRRWSFAREGLLAYGTVVDAAAKRIYTLLGTPGDQNYQGRWLASKRVRALIALGLEDGMQLWECPEVASVPIADGKHVRGPGQIVPCGERVVVFGNASVYNNERPYIASVDAAKGRLLFSDDEPFKKDYNRSGYNMLARDGVIWFAGNATRIWRYDPATGVTREVLTYSWNQRCTRLTATPRWLLFGQSGWFGDDLSGEQIAVARSGCALGNIPANGMTYYSPNACGCITMVRGFHALTGEAVEAPVADGQRLTKGGTAPTLADATDRLPPSGPIAEEWVKGAGLAAQATAPLTVDGLEVVAVVHAHRVEARRGGSLVWTASADARISGAPILVGDSVVFGAHDGCVYGVAAKDGAPRFRYLLAPARRLIVVNGQLESAWPVYGVVESGGRVVASAGTHPGLGGGVVIAALDPRSGASGWRALLTQRPNAIPAGGGRVTIVSHTFLNGPPRLDGERIVLGNGKGGSFPLTVGEDEAALNARLNSPPEKKKR